MAELGLSLWIPEDDTREHCLSIECWCQPEQDDYGIWWHFPEKTVKKREFKGWMDEI